MSFLFGSWHSSRSTGRPASDSQAQKMGYKAPLLEGEAEAAEQIERVRMWAHRRERALLVGHSCLLAAYLLAFALYVLRPETKQPPIVERVSLYSPAQVAIGSYSVIAIDGTVTRHESQWNISGKYAGHPTPEIDAAWDELTPPIPRIRLTHDEMLRAGYDIDDAYYFEDGDHTAILNVHHHLHCLNAIRKMTYLDYYTALGQHKSHDMARNHVDHCIEMLRQTLTCYADISPMPYIKDREGHIRPDFDVVQQCRDFESISKWNWENIDNRPLPAEVSA